MPWKIWSIGTISGGSPTIRGSPSTTWVSFLKACMLSLVLALSSAFSARLSIAFGASCRIVDIRSSTSRCEYQTSRLVLPANSRSVSR